MARMTGSRHATARARAADRRTRLSTTALLLAVSGIASPGEPPRDPPVDPPDPPRELERVRVVAPKYEDPFAFRNPIRIQGSAFDKYYRAPPTPEQVSLGGGYIQYGITYGLLKAAEQVTRLPGWKHQIQDATARPPPLDEAEMSRAMRLRDADEE
jgi:hypothetical protein